MRILQTISCTTNTYNVFRHFYPYFDITNVDWDTEIKQALSQSFIDKNGKDHLETLQKLTASLKDGHINVASNSRAFYIPPILWEWIENKLLITYVYDKSLPFKKGDIVTKIDGQLPEEYFNNVKSKISAATDGWLDYKAQMISLYGSQGSTLQITIDSNDIELTRSYTYSQVASNSENMPNKYKLIEDGIYYINLDLIEMDTINMLMPELEKSKAIICDLRGYPNGNHEFISYLLKTDDKDSSWMQKPQIIYPDFENLCGFKKSGWLVKAKTPYLGDKNIVFIINGEAISYAESYMSFIEGYKLATIVGQPTAGTNGNINPFALIGGYGITWTGMKVLKHDGSQHHGIGILPNVPVHKTIKGLKENRDEFLEKAIEVAKQPVAYRGYTQ